LVGGGGLKAPTHQKALHWTPVQIGKKGLPVLRTEAIRIKQDPNTRNPGITLA